MADLHSHAVEPSERLDTTPAPAWRSLPALLRSLGAATVVAAVSIFLLQGWDQGNDVQRYLILLAHTVGLAGLGFASGRWIGESKGARLLVALALASVPANFAVVGGFVYSQFGVNTAAMLYPAFATWQVASPSAALLCAASALVLLSPVAWLGFMVLTRRFALRFTALYMLTNAMLVLPVRDPVIVGWGALALTVAVLATIARTARGEVALRTPEGVIARTLQIVPVGLILARNLWLYSADSLLFTVIAMVAFLLLRHVALLLEPSGKARSILEAVAIAPAASAALGATDLFLYTLPYAGEFALPFFAFVFAGLVLEISLRSGRGGAGYRRLAAGIVSVALIGNLILIGGAAMAALCLLFGLALIVAGHMVEQRVIFVLGLLMLAVGLAYQLHYVIALFDLGSWASLALLGVAAILFGSAIERHGQRLKGYATQWGRQLRAWEN
ncbi:MAG: hypothetical protein AMJ69_01005 [Gammaproteobacteria bacterium SG8_47]|nr:MAG: hypothetical protein AMJ69_01005 [Gammaproteobacteria bacterium SG8_47]